jgi:hypothetical protein
MYTQLGHTPIKIARIYLRISTEEQDLTCRAAVKSRTGASLLSIFFGELTTPLSSTLQSTFHRLQPQIVVHCDDNFLLRTQITFRRLDRGVAEEKFDWLQVAAILSAQLRAGPSQIVRSKVLDPDLFRGGCRTLRFKISSLLSLSIHLKFDCLMLPLPQLPHLQTRLCRSFHPHPWSASFPVRKRVQALPEPALPWRTR